VSSPPVRPTTIKTFLKERTGELRISADAVDRLVELLTDAAEQIADAAGQLAIEEDRNTMMDRDVEAAFATFLQIEGPALLSPETLHTAIDGITNEAFIELLNLLRADLEAPV